MKYLDVEIPQINYGWGIQKLKCNIEGMDIDFGG